MPSDSSRRGAQQSSYLDFELEIGQGKGREYPVAVIHSPAGEARETMHFPFGELLLENRLQSLQIALLRSGGERRDLLLPEQQGVQEFGRDLFLALLSGEVRSRYDLSLQEATRQDKGLRLKLRIQAPELAALPWEYLYDPRQAEYVCLSRSTPFVRYLEIPQPIRPLTMTPPLRILGMVACPSDLRPLDVAREKQRLDEATKDLRAHGLLELEWLPGQTWRDLQRAMRHGPWHIFHFIGHGGFERNLDEGFIALVDEDGLTYRLLATELGRLLADHRSLRLVLLNSCEGARGSKRDIFSSTAAILVRRGIPAVLAMQYEITDQAAIEFARAFYEALLDGLAVDAAVAEARKAISLAVANTVEWGTPVLHMRSPDGVLFNIQKTAAVERRAREEAERKAREDAERKAHEQAERKAREEAERQEQEVAEREAGEEVERPAREEAARTEREEAERRAGEEAARLAVHIAPEAVKEEVARGGLRGLPLLIAVGLVAVIVILAGPRVCGIVPKSPTPSLTATVMPSLPTATAGPTAEPQPGTRRVLEPAGIAMVYVPAGESGMGSADADQQALADEKPQRTVYVDGYWIGLTEVTNAQFRMFIEAGGYSRREYWTDEGWQWKESQSITQPVYWEDGRFNQADYPVVGVSWYEAAAYAKWAGARLPTEAEWEKAARGTDGRIYPWGNEWDGMRGNFCDKNCELSSMDATVDDGYQYTAPVGHYPSGASPYGVLDMAGNVYEWVADWYDEVYYGRSSGSNPPGPASGSLRVLRGGSWYFDRNLVRCAYRARHYPNNRNDHYGFRVVGASGSP